MTAGKGGKLPLPEFGSKQANGIHCDSAKFNNLKIVFWFFLAINNALRYQAIVTTRRVAYVIGFIWTLSLVVSVFPYLGWRDVRPRIQGGYCQYHLHLAPSYILFLHVTVCLTPLTITCLAYCKIFQVARLQAHKIASMTVRCRIQCCFFVFGRGIGVWEPWRSVREVVEERTGSGGSCKWVESGRKVEIT